MSASRHIELPGCPNLRDLGGLPTRSGASVAWRRLYRGGELSRLGPRVADQLVQELGIRRVIDLRTPEEAGEIPCPLPEPCHTLNVPLLTSFRPHWIQPADQRPESTAARYLEMLEQGLAPLVRILRSLAEPPWRPALVHCAAGRDRTGILVAVLLDLLGVPEDVIAADYALSDGVFDDGQRARPDTVHHLLSGIRERHTSTRELLVRNGLSTSHIDQLQNLLLEQGGPRAPAGGADRRDGAERLR